MPYYTEEQIEKVRSIDILTYLQTYEPTELVHIRGNTFCTRGHDSLKISNGKWMWWSRGIGGSSALDYLIKVRGMKFIEAMNILSNNEKLYTASDVNRKEWECQKAKRKLLLPEESVTQTAIMWYLTGRGIDIDIIKECIDEGLLYESLPYHNCVFVGFDDDGYAAYAFFRTTKENERIMGEAAGSDKRYSFRIDALESDTIHVFESCIDLLSYATIIYMKTGEWRAESMISLGGVYAAGPNKPNMKLPVALDNALEKQSKIKAVVLHLDNDYAGKEATKSIANQLGDRYTIRNEPSPVGKDVNDYLMYIHYKRLEKQRRELQNESR